MSLLNNAELDDSTEPTLTFFKGKTETKNIALGVILAAAYAMTALITISVFIGEEGTISFAICIAPLFGILLGPVRGFTFGLVGGITAALLASINLAIWTVIFGPAMAGLIAGLCLRRSTSIGTKSIPGPTLAFVFFLLMVILYEIPNLVAWWFIIPHFSAGIVALLLQMKSIDFNPSRTNSARYLQFLPLCFIGTMAEHSMMMLGAVYLLHLDPTLFGFIIFPFLLFERTLAATVSTVIASAVLKAFEHELFTVDSE